MRKRVATAAFVFSAMLAEFGHSALCPILMLRKVSFQLPSPDGAPSLSFRGSFPLRPGHRLCTQIVHWISKQLGLFLAKDIFFPPVESCPVNIPDTDLVLIGFAGHLALLVGAFHLFQ